MLATWQIIITLTTGAAAGMLIGAIGVGGIIVVPILLEIDIGAKAAIASAMTSYIAAGFVGATIYFRKGHLDPQVALPVCAMAVPAAFAASLSLEHIGDTTVKAILYALMVVSSAFALVKTIRDPKGICSSTETPPGSATSTQALEQKTIEEAESTSAPIALENVDAVVVDATPQQIVEDGPASSIDKAEPLAATEAPEEEEEPLSRGVLALAGLVTGFASALTGTSGPVVGLPLLMLAQCPIRSSLGLVQAIQVPIALASMVAYLTLRPGVIQWEIVAALAVGSAPAVPLGAYLADKIPAAGLKLVVAIVLVVSSVVLVAKLALE